MALDPKVITILIVEDHPTTLAGLRSILEKAPHMKIIGEAQDGTEIKRLVADLQPQILLLDLIMPHLSPAELEKWVRANHPETVTLVLTAHDRDAYLANMMEAGAAGYLDKKLRAGQLLAAIRRAARGEILFDKEQIERVARWQKEVKQRWENLSEREQVVLQMLTEGADNKSIAHALNITTHTVEKHLTSVYQKLGVASRAEAMHWWFEKGGDFRN